MWLLKNDKEILAIPDESLRLIAARNKAESEIAKGTGLTGKAKEIFFVPNCGVSMLFDG